MSRHTPRHKDKSSQKIGILTTSKLKMAMLGVVWKTPKIQVTRSQKNHPKPKEGRKKGIQKKKNFHWSAGNSLGPLDDHLLMIVVNKTVFLKILFGFFLIH